jgi:hypothetical protein
MNDERIIRMLRGLDSPVDHVPEPAFADRLFSTLQRELRGARVSRSHLLVAAALTVTALIGATIATIGGLPRDDRAIIVPSPISSAAPSTSPIPALADCSDFSIATVTEAIRNAPSYAYEGEGYVERYEDLYARPGVVYGPETVPEIIVRMPLRFSGAYQAPDRSTFERALVYRDDVIEARRQVGDASWIRFLGSQRWRPVEGQLEEANALLALVERQSTTWRGPDRESVPGHCVLTGASTGADLERAVTVVVDPRSPIPVTVEESVRGDFAPDWGRIVESTEIYRVLPDQAVVIEAPTVDTGPARAEEALYALARRGCRDAPCDIEGVRVVYEAHNGDVDIFGYEGPGRHGTVWFQDGLVVGTLHDRSAAPSAFAVNFFDFHVDDELGVDEVEESRRWIGGPISGDGSLTMRITFVNGVEEEFAVRAPAYLLPLGAPDSPEVREISVLAANGDELFHYEPPESEAPPGSPPPDRPS